MKKSTLNQWTKVKNQDTYLETWMEAFLLDRKARGLSKGTIYFYHKKPELFTNFCDGRLISYFTLLNSQSLREYLIWLEERGHNPGGNHDCYRAVKTFLLWWEDEIEPEDRSTPFAK